MLLQEVFMGFLITVGFLVAVIACVLFLIMLALRGEL
jgi:hypothetical protein